jgi:hypothetical protein
MVSSRVWDEMTDSSVALVVIGCIIGKGGGIGLGTIGLGLLGSEEKEKICLADWEGRGRTSYLRAPMRALGSHDVNFNLGCNCDRNATLIS